MREGGPYPQLACGLEGLVVGEPISAARWKDLVGHSSHHLSKMLLSQKVLDYNLADRLLPSCMWGQLGMPFPDFLNCSWK